MSAGMHRRIRSPTGQVEWNIPFPNYVNTLHLDVAFGKGWRTPGGPHANHYMNDPSNCGSLGAKCSKVASDGTCEALDLSQWDPDRANITGQPRMQQLMDAAPTPG